MAPANQTKERSVHELFLLARHFLEQKFNVNRACFLQRKTPEFTKMGEIHELFVLALLNILVWFARATPDPCLAPKQTKERKARVRTQKTTTSFAWTS